VTVVRLASIDQVNEVTNKVYATFKIDKIVMPGPASGAVTHAWPRTALLLDFQAVRFPTMALSTLQASFGSSCICKPRCPPFRNTLDSLMAASSIAIGTRFFCAKGLIPPNVITSQPFGVGCTHHLCRLAQDRTLEPPRPVPSLLSASIRAISLCSARNGAGRLAP
jgi:hypothetical protein